MNKPLNIIFQGGGIKGLSYIGALRYLDEQNIKIGNVAGTSVGAIISSLIAAGYDSYELEDIINHLPLSILLPPKKENKVRSMLYNKGLYSMNQLEKYLDNLLIMKNKRYFSDFKVGNNYKVIFITTCLKLRKIFVLPHDLSLIGIDPDDFQIAKAACMSACLPLVYEPYNINGYVFLDGGISDNFPIWCYPSSLALQVTNENHFENYIKKKIFKSHKSFNDANIHHENVVKIDTKEFKAIDFSKGLKKRYLLYNRGYTAIKNYHLNYLKYLNND